MSSGGRRRIGYVDSHTAGEPTRVILQGGPDLGGGPVGRQLEVFRERYDAFRRATVCEPRGSDVLVGALLTPPSDPGAAAGVIFFNNVGFLGMCGHGTIGLVETLRRKGRMEPGTHRIETPVGTVTAVLDASGRVTIENVPSRRAVRGLTVTVPGHGTVTGDVAWGGNWFFLVKDHGRKLELRGVEALTEFAWRVRLAVNEAGHPEVDHIEFFGAPFGAGSDSRNFVLCPGKAYDRSPCGTGTSAKLACLAADGELGEGEPWVQEGILGQSFRGWFRWLDKAAGLISPSISGTAHLIAEGDLLLDESDPFCWGIG